MRFLDYRKLRLDRRCMVEKKADLVSSSHGATMERILRSKGDSIHGGRRVKGRGRKKELEIDKVG